jgi:hypothetical protein
MSLEKAQSFETPADAKAFREKLERQGYDGIRIPEAKTWIAFKPEQVKSTGNVGTFDEGNPDIRFSKADKADKPQVESEAFKQWSNNAPFIDRATAGKREFKSGEKVVVEAYHGTQRPDRIGDIFKRSRATSGPMAFFTSDPELASNYAKGKSDTSLSREDSGYETWFKYQPKGERTPVSIDRAWYRLTSEQRAKIAENAPRVTQNDDGEIVFDQSNDRGLGGYDQHIKEARGNALHALVEEWLNSGALFNDEERFEDVLRKVGFPTQDVKYDSPHAEYPFVYKTFIKMQRPLVTADIPAEVMGALDRAAKFDRTRSQLGGADPWDKESRSMRDWVEQLKRPEDAEHAWTSIPDKAAKVLEQLGYDGIIDKSGKGGGAVHPVYIPFRETQVKSAISNRGAFDESKKNIRFSKADAQEAKTAADDVKQFTRDSRENARGDIRAALASSSRNVGKADKAMESLRQLFDKQVKAYGGDSKKLYASISALERGEKVNDPLAQHFWDASSSLLKDQLGRLNSLGADITERANYFAHIWKDQGRAATEDLAKAKKEEASAQMGGRRPLSGNKQFTKERVFNTMEEGINAGREPISKNPVDMFMARYAQGEKLAAALTIKKSIGDRGLAKDLEGDRVPHGYARVNDGVFAGKALPELIARDLNNHLDPGLSKFAGWRSFRYVQNLMLSARLGLSAFHAGMTTLDSMASHIDVGVRRMATGDVTGALHELGKASLAPLTAIRELAGKGPGSKLVRQWFGQEAMDPNTAALLHMAQEGGARAHMNAVDYNQSLAQYRQAFRQGDWRKAAQHAIPAAIESTTHHIAMNLVPAQKMTARIMLQKFELDKLADKLGKAKGDYAGIVDAMAPDALRQISRKINADVDDRLGQFAYENEFWNKTLKDAAHASVQSVGWNFGSARLLAGGIADVAKFKNPEKFRGPLDKAGTLTDQQMSRLTGRLSYLITLNAVVGTMGAMTQYLLTGKGPDESKDFFFPKTGRKNADGSDERLAFPSYVKDEYAISHHPLQTVQHKLHPSLSMLAEIATNKDFYGNQVYNPEDDIPTEAKQFMEYLGKAFLPYSLQGASKNASTGSSAAMTALPFVGITPAPSDVTHSAFQNYVREHYPETAAGQKYSNQTPEQAAQSQKFFDALNATRRGENPDLSALTPKDRGTIRFLTRPGYNPFAGHFGKLSIQQQLHAYELATPEEREQYKLRQGLLKDSAAKLRALPEDQRQDVRKRLNAVVEQSRTQ